VHRCDIEAAFVAEPFHAAGLDQQAAFAEELVLIAPKSTAPVRTPADIRKTSLIAFAAGCSYRRILEDWLGLHGVAPDRVLELGSYHAIVACVAAGSGIAIVPRALLGILRVDNEVTVSPLPQRLARSKTCLVWRKGESSPVLEALRQQL
jgi:DNA-binding transcriptional LysR family regulator